MAAAVLVPAAFLAASVAYAKDAPAWGRDPRLVPPSGDVVSPSMYKVFTYARAAAPQCGMTAGRTGEVDGTRGWLACLPTVSRPDGMRKQWVTVTPLRSTPPLALAQPKDVDASVLLVRTCDYDFLDRLHWSGPMCRFQLVSHVEEGAFLDDSVTAPAESSVWADSRLVAHLDPQRQAWTVRDDGDIGARLQMIKSPWRFDARTLDPSDFRSAAATLGGQRSPDVSWLILLFLSAGGALFAFAQFRRASRQHALIAGGLRAEITGGRVEIHDEGGASQTVVLPSAVAEAHVGPAVWIGARPTPDEYRGGVFAGPHDVLAGEKNVLLKAAARRRGRAFAGLTACTLLVAVPFSLFWGLGYPVAAAPLLPDATPQMEAGARRCGPGMVFFDSEFCAGHGDFGGDVPAFCVDEKPVATSADHDLEAICTAEGKKPLTLRQELVSAVVAFDETAADFGEPSGDGKGTANDRRCGATPTPRPLDVAAREGRCFVEATHR